jgi:hypothetical protein
MKRLSSETKKTAMHFLLVTATKRILDEKNLLPSIKKANLLQSKDNHKIS